MKHQPTEEIPYIVSDYPYGFKKCICKFWIESNEKRGDRWVKQTQNPKTLVWNKPKKSTYSGVIVAYIDEEGHATYKSLYTGTDAQAYKDFVEWCGDIEFNKIQLDRLKYIRAVIKTYSGVTFSICGSMTEEEREEHEKKQKETQDNINRRVANNYRTDGGNL